MSDGVEELLKRHADRVDTYLKHLLATFGNMGGVPPRLLESIRYSLTAGGKRLRPALVLECYLACGGRALDTSTFGSGPPNPWDTALASAGAIELVHTFSLVHDDLPAMDDDNLRRGKPTNHIVFGEALAILAGDAMVALAFLTLANAEPTVVQPLLRELSVASYGMIGGQVLDMEGEKQTLSLEQLQQVHRLKTGAMLTAACRMGAIAAGAAGNQIEAVTRYGQHLGLAFQIVDDLLDVTATSQQTGKATNKDASGGKNTYPGLLGIDASRQEAEKQVEAAVVALVEFAASADGLRALARFVLARSR